MRDIYGRSWTSFDGEIIVDAGQIPELLPISEILCYVTKTGHNIEHRVMKMLLL